MVNEKLNGRSKFRVGRYSIIVAACIMLLIWWIETPAGVLGKADAIGYAVCHRIDLRSFHIGVRQMPLCVRCTGQYIGAVVGLLFQGIVARRRSGFPARWVFVVFTLLGLAYVLDGVNSYLSLPPILQAFPWVPHLYEPSNVLRLFTGTGMGVVLSAILYPAFVGSIYIERDPRPSIAGLKPLIGLIALCILVDLLILLGAPVLLTLTALISASGVIILLSLAYTIVILRIFKKDNTYVHFFQISLPIMIGFIVAMSQIALFDLLRLILTGSWNGLSLG